MSYFDSIPQIQFEGKESKNPFAYKFYDAKRIICGRTMEEWARRPSRWGLC